MKKSRANDELNNPEERPQHILRSYEASKSTTTWKMFLVTSYQSSFSEGGKKYTGPILDYCPACGGLGFLGGKFGDGEACLVCLTGENKNKSLGIPFYSDKPVCQFITNCPFKEESQKQEKCKKCICKFDSK